MVSDTFQLLKGHRFDHRKSQGVSINNHESCQMVLELDSKSLPAHSIQVHEQQTRCYILHINQTYNKKGQAITQVNCMKFQNGKT